MMNNQKEYFCCFTAMWPQLDKLRDIHEFIYVGHNDMKGEIQNFILKASKAMSQIYGSYTEITKTYGFKEINIPNNVEMVLGEQGLTVLRCWKFKMNIRGTHEDRKEWGYVVEDCRYIR